MYQDRTAVRGRMAAVLRTLADLAGVGAVCPDGAALNVDVTDAPAAAAALAGQLDEMTSALWCQNGRWYRSTTGPLFGVWPLELWTAVPAPPVQGPVALDAALAVGGAQMPAVVDVSLPTWPAARPSPRPRSGPAPWPPAMLPRACDCDDDECGGMCAGSRPAEPAAWTPIVAVGE